MVREKCRGCKWLAPTLYNGKAVFVCLKPIEDENEQIRKNNNEDRCNNSAMNHIYKSKK